MSTEDLTLLTITLLLLPALGYLIWKDGYAVGSEVTFNESRKRHTFYDQAQDIYTHN